jgi:uncharacterized protein
MLLPGRELPLLPFFLGVFILSIPFWWIGAVTGLELLPGLPVSALAAFCPVMAAILVLSRTSGGAGVTALHERLRPRFWLVPILLLMPAAMALAYGWMRALGVPLPMPHFAVGAVPGMFLAFFLAALGEELGWSGYAIDPMQRRWGALPASLLLGGVWAAWHVIALLQAHRAPVWIAWWTLSTVAARVLHTWLYNNTGRSVLGAALFHASSNLSWQLFPNQGSHYDPRFVGPILAVLAALVTILWGPRTLAGRRAA